MRRRLGFDLTLSLFMHVVLVNLKLCSRRELCIAHRTGKSCRILHMSLASFVAMHLFEEAGPLERVTELPRDWFLLHLL